MVCLWGWYNHSGNVQFSKWLMMGTGKCASMVYHGYKAGEHICAFGYTPVFFCRDVCSWFACAWRIRGVEGKCPGRSHVFILWSLGIFVVTVELVMICSGMLLSLGWTLQLNIGQETLRGLMANWMTRRRQRSSTTSTAANGDAESGIGEHHPDRRPSSDDSHDDSNSHQPLVLPAFEFSTSSPPSIITEGSQVCCTQDASIFWSPGKVLDKFCAADLIRIWVGFILSAMAGRPMAEKSIRIGWKWGWKRPSMVGHGLCIAQSPATTRECKVLFFIFGQSFVAEFETT